MTTYVIIILVVLVVLLLLKGRSGNSVRGELDRFDDMANRFDD